MAYVVFDKTKNAHVVVVPTQSKCFRATMAENVDVDRPSPSSHCVLTLEKCFVHLTSLSYSGQAEVTLILNHVWFPDGLDQDLRDVSEPRTASFSFSSKPNLCLLRKEYILLTFKIGTMEAPPLQQRVRENRRSIKLCRDGLFLYCITDLSPDRRKRRGKHTLEQSP